MQSRTYLSPFTKDNRVLIHSWDFMNFCRPQGRTNNPKQSRVSAIIVSCMTTFPRWACTSMRNECMPGKLFTEARKEPIIFFARVEDVPFLTCPTKLQWKSLVYSVSILACKEDYCSFCQQCVCAECVLFFVFFQLLETSRAGQTETFRPVNGSKSTRLTSRFKALGFESHRLRKQWERPQI